VGGLIASGISWWSRFYLKPNAVYPMDNEFLLFSEAEFGAFVGKSEIWARKLRYAGRGPVVSFIGRTPKYSRVPTLKLLLGGRCVRHPSPGGMMM
jgi:hypothetical protein